MHEVCNTEHEILKYDNVSFYVIKPSQKHKILKINNFTSTNSAQLSLIHTLYIHRIIVHMNYI